MPRFPRNRWVLYELLRDIQLHDPFPHHAGVPNHNRANRLDSAMFPWFTNNLDCGILAVFRGSIVRVDFACGDCAGYINFNSPVRRVFFRGMQWIGT